MFSGFRMRGDLFAWLRGACAWFQLAGDGATVVGEPPWGRKSVKRPPHQNSGASCPHNGDPSVGPPEEDPGTRV